MYRAYALNRFRFSEMMHGIPMSSVAPRAAIGSVGSGWFSFSALASDMLVGAGTPRADAWLDAVFVITLNRVVIVSDELRRFRVELLPVDATLSLFLCSSESPASICGGLIVVALLVLSSSGSTAAGAGADADADTDADEAVRVTCFVALTTSLSLALAISFTCSAGLSPAAPVPVPAFRLALVIAFLAATLAAVDTVDTLTPDRTDDAPDVVLVLLAFTFGLSLLGSTAGTGGLFFAGGVPAPPLTALRTLRLLFDDPADIVRVLKRGVFGAVLSRARVAALRVDPADVVEVWRDRGAEEDAVRKVDDASDTRDEGREEDVEARETREVGRAMVGGLLDLLASVTVLFRIVDATERTEAAELRTEVAELRTEAAEVVIGRVGLAGERDFEAAGGRDGGATFLRTVFLGAGGR
ncbi:hypothetical protein C0993_003843 [Termitomyces sp. T159_Od127]|nr:hypothetical protein C0993_003843 [Termitomyces sp. T159_Od127]